LLALGEVGLFALYREVMLPQSQIAMNQGFEFGWKLRLIAAKLIRYPFDLVSHTA